MKALNWWVRARIREQEEVNGYGVEWTIAACQEAMLLMDIERTTRERLSLATIPEEFNPDHFTAGILQVQTYLQSFLGVVLTFQTGKVVGLRLDCTDREFSRQFGKPWPSLLSRLRQSKVQSRSALRYRKRTAC